MSPDEDIILREPSPSLARGQQRHDTEQNEYNLDQPSSRPTDSSRKRALVGNALLQLPIWGFAMNYGVFQEYYSDNWTLRGSHSSTGVIGTTFNGVMYLSMPVLFAFFTRRWARKRKVAALSGAALTCGSFLLSSFSTQVWHLIATQGVMAALGCTLMYSPTTLSLGEWYSTRNRAVAYGIVFSVKNIVGSTCPFLFQALLDHYGFRTTLRIWTAIVAGTSIFAIFLIPTYPSNRSPSSTRHTSKLPWDFLSHAPFYVYSTAIILQSSGYGLPQTYLNTYAHEIAHLSQTSATLLLTFFNTPAIISSSIFGYLSDEKRFSLSSTTVAALSATTSALSIFLFWGLSSQGSMALLVLFSITLGFFGGGYSATWGGVVNEMEREAALRNEAIDTGLIYGLLNGARGIGYLSGGLAGPSLLKAGAMTSVGRFAYGTTYGPLIIFTGLCSIFGGWGVLWKWKKS